MGDSSTLHTIYCALIDSRRRLHHCQEVWNEILSPFKMNKTNIEIVHTPPAFTPKSGLHLKLEAIRKSGKTNTSNPWDQSLKFVRQSVNLPTFVSVISTRGCGCCVGWARLRSKLQYRCYAQRCEMNFIKFFCSCVWRVNPPLDRHPFNPAVQRVPFRLAFLHAHGWFRFLGCYHFFIHTVMSINSLIWLCHQIFSWIHNWR